MGTPTAGVAGSTSSAASRATRRAPTRPLTATSRSSTTVRRGGGGAGWDLCACPPRPHPTHCSVRGLGGEQQPGCDPPRHPRGWRRQLHGLACERHALHRGRECVAPAPPRPWHLRGECATPSTNACPSHTAGKCKTKPAPPAPFPPNPQPSSTCDFVKDTSLNGADVSYGVVANAETCCGACRAYAGCVAADFWAGEANGAVNCHLKASYGPKPAPPDGYNHTACVVPQ